MASRFGGAETSALPTLPVIPVIPSSLALTMAKYCSSEQEQDRKPETLSKLVSNAAKSLDFDAAIRILYSGLLLCLIARNHIEMV